MTNVQDVVAYIELRLPSSTPMEQHKLAYYAQAWHATWEGRALVPDTFEAWEHGPVSPDVWRAAKYGYELVVEPLGTRAREVVDAILDFYGHMTAAQLRGLTHSEAPWIDARGDCGPGDRCDEQITPDAMRRYYTAKAMSPGAPVPRRPVHDEPASVDEVLKIARAQNARWSETLAWLADR